MALIYAVEDDKNILEIEMFALKNSGYQVDGFECARDFYKKLDERQPDLVLLDIMLPGEDGFSLAETMIEREIPVLFLTAEAANVAHLQSLFDLPCDALVHPFSPKQLMNAVENLLLLAQSLLRAGPLRLDTLHHRVTMAGEHLTLTAQEFALLEVLVKTPGAAVSRETLLRTAWGYQDLGETRTVDVHIQRLRRKLGKSCIETVYKTGYKLKMA